MKMSEQQQQQQQQQQSKKKKGKRSGASKQKCSPFYPNTPSAVGSPTIGSQINRRTVRQLTPQKLCSLVLPPPLLSLFDADEHHSILDQHQGSRQTSNASVSAGSTSTLYNARLPSHIRVGFANCDPLLVFEGKYVLVGTADGRIVVYSILEFDNDVSYDVKMSERRRRKEWDEEDEASRHDADENNEKEEKKIDAEIGEVTEEENEWEMREIMNKKEKARLIEPLVVVTLPIKRKNTTLVGSEDDKGNTNTSLFSPPTIVDICATPNGTGASLVEQRNTTDSTRPMVGDDFFGHAAILTDDGEVHILEFASDASNTPVVTIILSFDTESSGATSICMRPAYNGKSESLVRLCVGCDSGMLLEYQLHSTSHQDSGVQRSPIPQPLLRQRSHEMQSPMRPDLIGIERQLSEPVCHPVRARDPVTVKASLCWQGFVDAPIRSLSCPGWGESESIIQSLLVVGTEQRQYSNTRRDQTSPNNELSPAISLEMINTSLAESLWRKAKNEVDPKDTKDTKHIHLCDCSVWPAAGMELKYGWLHSSTKQVPDVKQKPNNTIEQHCGSATSKICCFGEPQTCFASAASDGTVAISHCSEDGSWGVTDENNQVLFCHKVVGIGTIANGQERYLACCLRGGTMYLLPVAENSKSRKDIIMYATPVDPTDFGTVRYVHGFAAGMAQVKPWNNIKDDKSGYNTKCTAMVAWSGGKMDVYELDTGESRDDHLLLQKFAEKGTISKIVEMMLTMEEDHRHLQTSSALWKQAWEECKQAKEDEGTIVKSIMSQNDDNFEGMRSLLLHLIKDVEI